MNLLSRSLRAAITLLSAIAGSASAEGEAAKPVAASDLSRIQRTLAAREYEASANGHGLQAPNRAHNLRTYFESTGVRIHDRTAEGSPELLGLALAGVGREGALEALSPGVVSSEKARVEIRRDGLLEWYENSPEGLEQGFTLAERPDGEGPLALELSLHGATASAQGDGLVFATRVGRRLAYSKLVVTDASARTLPANLEASSPDRVRIVVEDAGATYPLVIDPLLTETADTQIEANQVGAELGRSVAFAGDVNGDGYGDLIIGASSFDAGQTNEGAAFVFHGGPGGIPNNLASNAAQLESNQADATFGWSVAGAGDVNGDGYADVIVGATNYDAGQTNEGAAFVFLGSASGIGNGNPSTAHAQLEANQGTNVSFGWSVAGAGDVNGDGFADVIVSAPDYDAGLTDEGAAFVFLGSASGIASGNPSTAHAQLESNQFGSQILQVAGAGDVNGDGYGDVIVSSNFYDSGEGDEGAAFVFLGSASGIASGNPSTAHARLESNQANALLGYVAGVGDVNGDGFADVAVGSSNYDAGQGFGEGAVFVFHGSASGIANGNPSTANAQLESNQGIAALGPVSAAGDVNGDGYADVIVGAFQYDAPTSNEGAAFVFLGSASGVGNGNPVTAYAQLESNLGNAIFGSAVGGGGDVNGDGYADVLVGAPGYSVGEGGEGAAYVYHGGAQGILDGSPSTATAQLESNQGGTPSEFGGAVASAGDVNGDGYADVIVGASAYDAGQGDEGAAFIFHGSAAGIASGNPTTAATQLESNQGLASFGGAVASAGDVNGDGYADVIVGAHVYDAGQSNEGAAFIFHGSASGVASGNPSTAATQLEANQATAFFGLYLDSAGDVNGDGYADVIVGAYSYDAGETDEGAAFVFHGSASGVASGNPSTANAQLEGNQATAWFGGDVAGAGDVNGDGFADVIVGANLYDAGQSNEGAAFVFHGSATGIASGNPSTAATQLETNQGGSFLLDLDSAGDVNGDGYADVILGASNYDAGEGDEGAAFVFHGSASGIPDGNPTTAPTQLESNQMDAILGYSVAGAGDVNGDGYADVIVSARSYSNGHTNEGAAFVFHGSASGIPDGNPATAAAQIEANQTTALLGSAVAGAGDVNGDGYADVVVGAYRYDAGQTDEGAVFVYYGNGNRTGRPVLAQQLAPAGFPGYRIAPWGASLSSHAFRAGISLTHPAGRGRVMLEVEACPSGVPFGHASCTRTVNSQYDDYQGSPLAREYLFFGLAEQGLYRWRARALHAPFSVIQGGVTPPPKPAHGPWRRFQGQAFEADIRMSLDTDDDGQANEIDTDDDGDGLLDAYETDTGTYVSPTNTGSDPLDSDSDDDGMLDGAEVAILIDPNDPDHDDDGNLDGADNCPAVANSNQANGDTWAAGNACQCGDVTGDGVIAAGDYTLARQHVVKGTPLTEPDRCDVTNDSACDVEDLAVLERLVNLVVPPPAQLDRCSEYLGP